MLLRLLVNAVGTLCVREGRGRAGKKESLESPSRGKNRCDRFDRPSQKRERKVGPSRALTVTFGAGQAARRPAGLESLALPEFVLVNDRERRSRPACSQSPAVLAVFRSRRYPQKTGADLARGRCASRIIKNCRSQPPLRLSLALHVGHRKPLPRSKPPKRARERCLLACEQVHFPAARPCTRASYIFDSRDPPRALVGADAVSIT